MNGSAAASAKLREEAADWFCRVRAGKVDAETYTAWTAWIDSSPAHQAAFAAMQETWDVARDVSAPPWPGAEELLQWNAPEPGDDRPASAKSANHRLWSWAAAIAGTLGLAIVLASMWREPGSRWFQSRADADQRIVTRRGEQQSVVLPDGSQVELGGLTGVELRFTPSRRLVIADEGEAIYRVRRDAARPFVVESGPVRVTAIGTAFAVRREGDTISVTVIEGVVDVGDSQRFEVAAGRRGGARLPLRVAAGQRVQLHSSAAEPMVLRGSTSGTESWRRGWLRFEDEPLSVVVASLNRYSTSRILIEDPSLEALRFTGTVPSRRVEEWLKAIPFLFPVRLRRDGPEQVVIEARD